MTIPSARLIVDQLHHAGLTLSLAATGGLAVTPSSRLTADLRVLIRTSKTVLVDWLIAANDASSPELCPPDNGVGWKELAAVYHAHHFSCRTCCGAGQGRGLRCGVGSVLWDSYQSASS